MSQSSGRRFRLLAVPTLMVVAMLPVLIGLGVWQLQRMDWKGGLIAHIDDRMAAEPTTMPAVIEDAEAWDYRRVSVQGRFLDGSALIVLGRTHQGRAGGHLIAAFERTDGAALGRHILVNRGWVPDAAASTDAWEWPAGEVMVEGVLRLPAPQGTFQPDNVPEARQWYWVDLAAMATALAIDTPQLILEAADADPRPPIGGQTRLDIPNNHLQYAITWFGLAGVLVVIFVLYQLRRGREEQ